MRILIVTPVSPPSSGTVAGWHRRLGMFIRALSKVGTSLDILHYVSAEWLEANSELQYPHESQSADWGTEANIRTTLVPKRKLLSRHIVAILCLFRPWLFFSVTGRQQVNALESCLDRTKPDLIFVHRLDSMGPIFKLRRKLPPLLFDLDDIEHWVKIQSVLAARSFLRKFVGLLHVPAIFFSERQAIKASAQTFVCSQKDHHYLVQLGMPANLIVIPNAAPFASSEQTVPIEKTILFLGPYSFHQNAEAAQRLISRIWPSVRRRVPTARLIIAGSSPERIPAFQNRPIGVEFTGFVDDLTSLYSHSRVICCPMITGAGTRMKLIEAASNAKPMVSTAVGAHGLLFDDDIEILIRNHDEGIVDACIRLLEDDALCARLGSAAYQKALALYDMDFVQKQIVEKLQTIIATNQIGLPTVLSKR